MRALVLLLILVLPSAAFASMIKLYCVRADDSRKACYRVVHVLTEKAAKDKEAQGCVRAEPKKDATTTTTKPTKDGANSAR